MRLFFIPGYGEEETIFDKIHPHLPGEKVFLSLWKLLPNAKRPELNAFLLAKQIIEQYAITPQDLIIGHSTGGWVALHMKQIARCQVIQIASWTDPGKVVTPVTNRHLIFFAVKTGLYLNSFVLRRAINKYYYDKPSKDIFIKIFTGLIHGNRENVVNQLRIIFNPSPQKADVQPDLAIHARADHIIRYPDTPFHEVPGDHFSLYTHPDTVYTPILHHLQQKHVS